MRTDIKNQYGSIIGYSKEDANRIEYYLLVSGMIGYWDKRIKRYIAIGKGGSGMKSQSDIGVGEVYRMATLANKKSTGKKEVKAEQNDETNTKITILPDGTVVAENNDIDEMFADLIKKGIF